MLFQVYFQIVLRSHSWKKKERKKESVKALKALDFWESEKGFGMKSLGDKVICQLFKIKKKKDKTLIMVSRKNYFTEELSSATRWTGLICPSTQRTHLLGSPLLIGFCLAAAGCSAPNHSLQECKHHIRGEILVTFRQLLTCSAHRSRTTTRI